MKRLVIKIDEEKCNGCGVCVPSCAEGALQIIDGKARLVSDVLCDGLGACLGECPEGALTVEEREAPAFDEEAVKVHLGAVGRPTPTQAHAPAPVSARPAPAVATAPAHSGGGCPGSRVMAFAAALSDEQAGTEKTPSRLSHWPVQLMLMPVRAPHYAGATLLLCADCVPFAYPDFHRDLLQGKVVAVGCPKLDDAGFYAEKLAKMIEQNDFASITVAHMEVPCCFGLTRLVAEAQRLAGKDVPVRDLTVTVQGELVER